MKDWDYYQTPVGVERFSNEDRDALKKQMLDEINNATLTALDRTKRLQNLSSDVSQIAREHNKPFDTAITALKEEFWVDCRLDLGYTQHLNDTAVARLEQLAWDNGHSCGYSEVYNKLEELSDFIEDIIANLKPKN